VHLPCILAAIDRGSREKRLDQDETGAQSVQEPARSKRNIYAPGDWISRSIRNALHDRSES
jgi:hypothetical protein